MTQQESILLAADTYARAFRLWSAGQNDQTLTATVRDEQLYAMLIHAEEQYTMLALGLWRDPVRTLPQLIDHTFLYRAQKFHAAIAHLLAVAIDAN